MGEGPLVLAFHGFPDTPHTWKELGPHLAAKGFRVVAPFMRGYAPTEAPQTDTVSRELGLDVVGLANALTSEPAHLVGSDWGAEAVYAAVGLEPTRFKTLHRAAVKPSLRHFSLELKRASQRTTSRSSNTSRAAGHPRGSRLQRTSKT